MSNSRPGVSNTRDLLGSGKGDKPRTALNDNFRRRYDAAALGNNTFNPGDGWRKVNGKQRKVYR